MAFAITRHGGIRKHEKYKESMDRLHRGDWKGAIRGFEELLKEFPDNDVLKETLEDTRYKAGFDSHQRIRPRRWVFTGGKRFGRIVILLGLAILLWQGYLLLQQQIAPLLAQRAAERTYVQWFNDASAALALGKLDEAEVIFTKLLDAKPEHEGALAGIEQIKVERHLIDLYQQADTLFVAGDCASAVKLLGDIQAIRAGYQDVGARISFCNNKEKIDQALNVANFYYSSGKWPDASSNYEIAKGLGAKVLDDGSSLDLRLSEVKGKWAVEQLANPPLNSLQLDEALQLLQNALKLNPANQSAERERRTLGQFVNGYQAHAQKRWEAAVNALREVYSERPLYLKGQGIPLLYEAYVGYGDALVGSDDCALAYEQYQRAAAMSGVDTTVAKARIEEVVICITPTATPTDTPTETPTPAPTGTPRPTPTPLPLAVHKGKIVFKSDNPDQPGFYVMNPDGSNRTFLAPLGYGIMQKQYDQLIDSYRWSPDGRTRSYVTKVNEINQIWMERTDGTMRPRAITHLADVTYDPQWSPDGTTIAFVSQDAGSDDVWLINADGSNIRNLINDNHWEWDKWVTWSPDSTRLAFMSNRYGARQVYVMDANGRNTKNISNVPYDEYEPLWIR